MTLKNIPRHNRAFTFIELIIAVTIFAVIAVSIYSTFNAGIRVWLKTSPMIEENQSLRIFFGTVAADLKNAVAYYPKSETLAKPVFGAEYEGRINFEGAADRMSFITVIGVSDPETGFREELARVTYAYDKDKKCLRRLVATAAEGLNEDNARSSEILKDINEKDFGIEYCYKAKLSNTEYEYEWRDAWEEKNVQDVPRGVRIKVGEFRKTVFVPTGILGEEE
ncbi:MAG: type II secretion system protein GspJ [Candidatus Omnitrophica bacterium]|nr:type II secretion system protein GspJ [Candidatus Omnitrophota bacterium]